MRLGGWRRVWTVGLLAGAVVMRAQAGAKNAFDVASVRASAPGGDGMSYFSPPGSATFTARNISLLLLIQLAYGLEPYQIQTPAKLGWVDAAEYDVMAKREGETAVSYEQLKPRLQLLLQQRFHLLVHHESKEMKGYVLVVARDGPRLEVSKGGAHQANILPNGLMARNMTVKDVASLLGHATRRPVVDRTQIAGSYDVKLQYAPEGAEDSALPSVFTAVQEQLGLKLEPQQVPVDVVVIDSVDRTPTEN